MNIHEQNKDHKDHYCHLETFYEHYATIGLEANQEELAYMKLFPFSLIGEAKKWIKSKSS